jgi:UDPglucose 6-dehydrogenase
LRHDLEGEDNRLEGFELVPTDMQALEGADALMVLTEWKNFHNPDFLAMKELMRYPLILDGRNLYNPEALRELGMAYQGVGRRNNVVLSYDPVLHPTSTLTIPVTSALMHA